MFLYVVCFLCALYTQAILSFQGIVQFDFAVLLRFCPLEKFSYSFFSLTILSLYLRLLPGHLAEQNDYNPGFYEANYSYGNSEGLYETHYAYGADGSNSNYGALPAWTKDTEIYDNAMEADVTYDKADDMFGKNVLVRGRSVREIEQLYDRAQPADQLYADTSALNIPGVIYDAGVEEGHYADGPMPIYDAGTDNTSSYAPIAPHTENFGETYDNLAELQEYAPLPVPKVGGGYISINTGDE